MSPPKKPVYKIARDLEIDYSKFDPKRVARLLRKIFAPTCEKEVP